MYKNKIIEKMPAPAKINLYLRVTGERDDGYTEIETLFVPLSEPCDQITIFESDLGIVITSDSDNIPLDESNICFKTALTFAKFANIEPNWNIHIEKKIPVAAGLGGGSSDAAAVLNILNENVKQIEKTKLAKIAGLLGADVPFFLKPVPSIGTGIGEILSPVEIQTELNMVLVNPLFPISAGWAYEAYKRSSEFRVPSSELCKGEFHIPPQPESSMDDILVGLKSGYFQKTIVNDLAPAVYEKFPIMQILSEKMKSSGAVCTGMSGSGPTLFGICESRNSAANLAEKMKTEYGDAIWCTTSKILTT